MDVSDYDLIDMVESMDGDEVVEGLGRLAIANIAQLARKGLATKGRIPRAFKAAMVRKARSCPAPKLRQRTILGDTVHCRRNLPNSALALSSKLQIFHAGVGEDRAKLGYTAGTEIDQVHTNLEPDGRLPTGENFSVYGIGVEIRSTVEADINNIRDCLRFVWRQSSNQEIRFRQVGKLPPRYRQTFKVAGSTDTVRFEPVGPVFMESRPLFTITGQEKPGDKAYGYLEVIRAFTPSVATEVEVQLYGRGTQNI